MPQSRWLLPLAILLVAAGTAALGWRLVPSAPAARASIGGPNERDGMVLVPGGTFRMGNDFSDRPDQRPAHDVALDPFWMDAREVTNRQFARFVEATGHVTAAERRGWSEVFDPRRRGWARCAGATWRHPGGPDTTLDNRDDYPVVHVSWHDATAYAQWAGKRLPTEAEWERAARAGLRDADYPWGPDERPDGRYEANYFQGWYPDEDLAVDGFDGLAPVGSYLPNRFGLFDVSGNVAEWCADRHAAEYYAVSPPWNPAGPDEGPARVCRGGSWLSAENAGADHKVSARGHHAPETSRQDLGFRCARSDRD
ncbi:MAG: formylglycine-generating enzyme family protein [Pirellulales bacterium]|nr:formylglycine-generating enzyme family protein [Pirellulales bacterium]